MNYYLVIFFITAFGHITTYAQESSEKEFSVDKDIALCLEKDPEELTRDGIKIFHNPNATMAQKFSKGINNEIVKQGKMSLLSQFCENANANADGNDFSIGFSQCYNVDAEGKKVTDNKNKSCDDSEIQKAYRLLALCKMIANKNSFGSDKGEVAPFVPISSNPAPSAKGINGFAAKGFGGGPGCMDTGYAEDYVACRRAVNAYNAFSLAEVGLQTGHAFSMKSLENELSQQVALSQGDSQVTIEVQKMRLKKQRAHNNQFTSLYGTQAGFALTKAISKWPKRNNLHKKHSACKGKKDSKNAACCRALVDYAPAEVLPNRGVQSGFVALAAQIGIKIAKLQIANKEIDRQLALLGDHSEDLPIASNGIDTLVTYCQSPEGRSDEKCSAFASGNISQVTAFNDSLGNRNGFSATNLEDIAGSRSIAEFNPSDEISSGDQSTIGDGLQDFNDKGSNSGFVNNPRAARVGQGGGAGGGGGSGGGGSGGGGSGPGLSQKPRTASSGNSRSLSKVKSDGVYSKSKKGLYKSSGKRRRSRGVASKKSRRNLSDLSNLFKKSSDKLSPVGPKSIDIFVQISTKYNDVVQDERIQ